jgi:hypothetical protein
VIGSLIGQHVFVQISDPWEIFEQVGNNGGLNATIVATIEPELLLKLDLPITVGGKQYRFLTASCRFVGASYGDHKKNQIIASNFIAANGYVSLKATPPSDTLGMIGTLGFLQT